MSKEGVDLYADPLIRECIRCKKAKGMVLDIAPLTGAQ